MIISANLFTIKVEEYILKYSSNLINEDYLKSISGRKDVSYVFHTINNEPNNNEISTIIAFVDTSLLDKENLKMGTHKTQFTILLFLVNPLVRNVGYGSLAMCEFFEYCKLRFGTSEFVLYSIKSSVQFYIDLGFQQIEPTYYLKNELNLDDPDDIKKCFSILI